MYPLQSKCNRRILHFLEFCGPFSWVTQTSVCAVLSHWVLSSSLWPHGLWPARPLCPRGFSRQEYWSGLPCPPPGHFPNLSNVSRIGGRFFVIWATREALLKPVVTSNSVHSQWELQMSWGLGTFAATISRRSLVKDWALKQVGASLPAQRLKHLPAMQETQVQSLGREDPLEKEMATHSSIIAWRIPWMEEPGGLQSMGSQRVGHDWATSLTHSLTQTGGVWYWVQVINIKIELQYTCLG